VELGGGEIGKSGVACDEVHLTGVNGLLSRGGDFIAEDGGAVLAHVNIQVSSDVDWRFRSFDDELARIHAGAQVMRKIEGAKDDNLVVAAFLHLNDQIAGKLGDIQQRMAVDGRVVRSGDAKRAGIRLGDRDLIVIAVAVNDQVFAKEHGRGISTEKQPTFKRFKAAVGGRSFRLNRGHVSLPFS